MVCVRLERWIQLGENNDAGISIIGILRNGFKFGSTGIGAIEDLSAMGELCWDFDLKLRKFYFA